MQLYEIPTDIASSGLFTKTLVSPIFIKEYLLLENN